MKFVKRQLNLLFLIAILAGGVASFIYLNGNQSAQFIIGVVTAIAYFLWGIIHHLVNNDLHKKVVIEYALIGALAVILLSIVLRS
jgi:hypothetical protein